MSLGSGFSISVQCGHYTISSPSDDWSPLCFRGEQSTVRGKIVLQIQDILLGGNSQQPIQGVGAVSCEIYSAQSLVTSGSLTSISKFSA